MKQVWIPRVGPPEVLMMREAPDPEPRPGTVRIAVKASGINFADIMARMGLYPDAPKLPAVVGYEVSGVVDAIGNGVSGFRVGDRVVGICRFGGYSDSVVVPAGQVFSLPETLGFFEAAALPVNYLTAYQALVVMGGMRKGDRVLVHSAGGGVGLAAIDLCRHAGAEVIGTASRAKHEALRARGVTHLIDYRTEDFEARVREITDGQGVNLILDAVGGESWAKGLRCLAPTGRLIAFGFAAAVTGTKKNLFAAARGLLAVPWLKCNPITLMNENKGILGVNMGRLWERPDLVRAWGDELLALYEQGHLHPTVDARFPFEQASAAHRYLQDRKNFGKVTLVP